ncbi:hypothetical protein PCANC_16052 [Puccinia coronata f. sp. avenae]|uniref:Uncharacterized protein n=1 Tax=Puccinia coronata f. sp. avenae TaxID=200324 RepID=A0A2N5S341_9BASI|nr:hypothetical protein PCANC_26851 [Puccinia coronata f. sp. avenae]PLW34618.1 hypothetical protein PCANC_16052 [Puccinia coronata f. sp. avenae]PLW45000.1 hypothetical protein PCASD_06952 [Puccinia coronata f. sp. avenae]
MTYYIRESRLGSAGEGRNTAPNPEQPKSAVVNPRKHDANVTGMKRVSFYISKRVSFYILTEPSFISGYVSDKIHFKDMITVAYCGIC